MRSCAGDDLVEILAGVCVEPLAVVFLNELAVARNRQQRTPQIVGDDRREVLEFAVAAGEFVGAQGHGAFQIDRVVIDPFQAGPMDVPQQFAAIAQFFQISERAEIEGLLDGIVGSDAGVNDDADLIVDIADSFEKLSSAEIGKAIIDHRHVEVALLNVLQGFRGGTATDRVKSFLLEYLAEQLHFLQIVFDNQHVGKAIGRHSRLPPETMDLPLDASPLALAIECRFFRFLSSAMPKYFASQSGGTAVRCLLAWQSTYQIGGIAVGGEPIVVKYDLPKPKPAN